MARRTCRWSAGISLSFDHETVQNVLQDFLWPVFTTAQQSIAAPDPYTNRTDYLNDLANGVVHPRPVPDDVRHVRPHPRAEHGLHVHLPFAKLGLQAGYLPQLRLVNYDESLYRPFEQTVRDNNHTWEFIDKITLGINLDGRDIYWNPTKGYYLGQSFTYTGGLLFGQRSYIRSDTTAEGFLTLLDVPVFEGWNFQMVLAAHSAVSFILPNFGYVERRLGMAHGDRLHRPALHRRHDRGSRLEVRRGRIRQRDVGQQGGAAHADCPRRRYGWSGFFDAAGLWVQPYGAAAPETSFDRMTLDQFYFSTGFGIRFTIPQFPIRLYLAKGFQVQNGRVVWKPLAPGDLAIGNFNFSFVISLGGNTF